MQPCFSPRATSQRLIGNAVTPPTTVARLIRNQKAASVGSRESGHTFASSNMVGIMPTMTKFIDTVSAKKVFLTASQYRPSNIPIIMSAWKMNNPHTKPATYSSTISQPVGTDSAEAITAAIRMPVASPARQCTSLLTPCFQVALV